MNYLAIDIGGTFIKYAVITESAEIISKGKKPTDRDHIDVFLDTLEEIYRENEDSGPAGVAISLAMQGALGNLIGGFILLLFKPIKAGEYVKIGDNEGSVKSIGAFYTELVTIDNRLVHLPNGSLTNTAIVNFTREGTRRLDLTFSVGYESDMDQVYEVLDRVVSDEKALLKDPAPTVNLLKCGDSSLDFTVRVWINASDYWPVYFRMLDNGKRALDKAGINIPYPQMDVHMK